MDLENKRNDKQKLELFMATPVLNGMNISPKNCISYDKPDIIVPKDNDEAIGIEVVSYRPTNNEEAERALYKEVLYEYGAKLDKELNKKYVVTVFFHDAELHSDINYKNMKKQLIREMENCRLNSPEKLFNEYISSVNLCEVPNLAKTFVGMIDAFWGNNVDELFLEELIAKKNKKLTHYNRDKKYNITEWWLIIFFPTTERTDFSNFQLNKEFVTDYDHVFLSEPSNLYKKIK